MVLFPLGWANGGGEGGGIAIATMWSVVIPGGQSAEALPGNPFAEDK
jgi:hypothetical protein